MPSFINPIRISLISNFISIPIISPFPRISLIIVCFSLSFSNPSLKIFPIFSEFSINPSSVNALRDAIPAAQDNGFPPNVEECSPLFIEARMSGLTRVTPIGTPPAIPFARHKISGTVFQ